MEYRRRAGISNIDNKESILGSINSVQNMSRQPNNSAGHPSSSLANKNTMLDHSSDLNILNAAAQMAASGSSFNEFLSQQASKGFGGPNSNFTDMMNVNNGSNSSVLNQSAGNSSSSGVIAPADSPNVLSIGAVDFLGDYIYFSSQGNEFQPTIKPDISAQGYRTFVINSNEAENIRKKLNNSNIFFLEAIAYRTHPQTEQVLKLLKENIKSHNTNEPTSTKEASQEFSFRMTQFSL